jgi:hypothetical protein
MDGSFRWIEDRCPEDLISSRIEGLTQWLAENCPNCDTEQRHLDEGAAERAYWHYGYLCALRDVVKLIYSESVKNGTTRTFPT